MADLSMTDYALQLLKPTGTLLVEVLAYSWFSYKNQGRFPPAASRSRFGLTSAAYRTARTLRDRGLVSLDRNCKMTLL